MTSNQLLVGVGVEKVNLVYLYLDSRPLDPAKLLTVFETLVA